MYHHILISKAHPTKYLLTFLTFIGLESDLLVSTCWVAYSKRTYTSAPVSEVERTKSQAACRGNSVWNIPEGTC